MALQGGHQHGIQGHGDLRCRHIAAVEGQEGNPLDVRGQLDIAAEIPRGEERAGLLVPEPGRQGGTAGDRGQLGEEAEEPENLVLLH